ncbi:MAG: PD-(D/E)XK nuclease family protein [Deltaproteobacteria bacterium]|nr:PD-(D/E)XK nuclease family protein [Kofleriaceae bacterium]
MSVSQIKTYLRCPRQYELHYVLGEPAEHVASALLLGTAVHAALGAYYTVLRDGLSAPLEMVLEVFAGAWIAGQPAGLPVLTEDGEPLTAVEQLGRRMLKVFHSRQPRLTGLRPVLIESPFAIELHHPETGELLDERMIGVIDLVADIDGRRMIIEHKTAARRYGRDQLDHDLQPTAYLIASRVLGLGAEGLAYQIITKTAEPAIQHAEVNRTVQQERELMMTVLGVLRAIDAGVFYPVRGWQCRTCAHRQACDRRTGR